MFARYAVGFEDAIFAISSGMLLKVKIHPNKQKYPHQWIFIVKLKNYVYAVPFVYNDRKSEIFLKTMFPSRKLNKKYLNEKK